MTNSTSSGLSTGPASWLKRRCRAGPQATRAGDPATGRRAVECPRTQRAREGDNREHADGSGDEFEQRGAPAKDRSGDRLKELGDPNIKSGRELWVETVPKVIPYAKPYWKLVALSMTLTVLGGIHTRAAVADRLVFDQVLGSDQGSTGFLGDLANSVVGDGKAAVLVFAIGALFMLTVLEGSTTLLNRYVDTKLKLGMVLDFMSVLFQHFQRLGLTFHQKKKTGALMNKVNQAPQGLGDFVSAAAPIVQSAVTLLGMFVVAVLIDWQVALALAIVPLLYYQISVYSKRVIPRLRAVGQLEMNVMSITHETMQMLRLIVGYGREQHEYRRFRDQAQIANRERMKVTIHQTLFSIGVNVATAAGTALVLGRAPGTWWRASSRLESWSC